MSSDVPIELAERVIDFLHDDVCALASRALLPTARYHMWQQLTVPVQTQPQHIRMQELLEILDGNPDIAPLLRSLTLRGVVSESARPRDRIHEHGNDPTGNMRLWERFPNLRVLKFVSFKFTMGLHQLLPMAYSLPNLEELAVLDSDAMLPRRYSRPRPLYRESILGISAGVVAWSFLEDLAKLLLEPSMHAPLVDLDLNCVLNSRDFRFVVRDHTDTLPSQAWAPPANLANLYDSLKQCARLETLSLPSYAYPTGAFAYRPFLFLDMLAELLSESSSGAAGACEPFPKFGTLWIMWLLAEDSECVLGGGADACTKLARAPEDRAGYPVLKLVVVSLRLHGGERSAAEREELEALASVARYRSCLARVARLGVQVEVSVD
ncbi:hypothetical protein V8D89_002199 [Ganoderma adspersum]